MKQLRLKEVNLPLTKQPTSGRVGKKARHSASGTQLRSLRFETGFRGPSFQKLQMQISVGTSLAGWIGLRLKINSPFGRKASHPGSNLLFSWGTSLNTGTANQSEGQMEPVGHCLEVPD